MDLVLVYRTETLANTTIPCNFALVFCLSLLDVAVVGVMLFGRAVNEMFTVVCRFDGAHDIQFK